VAAVQQIRLTTRDWATLLKRVWGFDALTSKGCGGRMRFIAVIKDRAASERILRHMGEDAEEEIARVAIAWDAEALATAQAARAAYGRAVPHGQWPGEISARDLVEDRDERGRACRGQRRRGGTRGSHPRGTRAGGEGAATSWRDAVISSAGDAGGRGGDLIGAGRWVSFPRHTGMRFRQLPAGAAWPWSRVVMSRLCHVVHRAARGALGIFPWHPTCSASTHAQDSPCDRDAGPRVRLDGHCGHDRCVDGRACDRPPGDRRPRGRRA
jgi:hypothetical protein